MNQRTTNNEQRTTKLRIGVLGCADIADRSMIPAVKEAEEFELIAVASRSEEKAVQFANKFNCEPIRGYENIINRKDIDALYIPLPTGLHEEWVTKALHEKKHLLVEKSFAVDDVSAKIMTDLAILNKCVVMEDFMFQYHSQHQFVFDLLNNNELGDIRVFRSSFGFPPMDHNNFRYDNKLGGGCLLDSAAYTVKAASFILNSPLSVQSSFLHYDKTRNVDIWGSASLIDSNGRIAQLSFGFDNFYQCNYEIWGSKGKCTAHKAFTPRPDNKPKITLEKQDFIKDYLMPEDNHFIKILKAFHTSIIENEYKKNATAVLTQCKLLSDIKRKATINEL